MFIHASDNAPTTEMIMTVGEIQRAVMKNNQRSEPVGTSKSKGTKDSILKIRGRKGTERIFDLKASSCRFYLSRHKNTRLMSIPLRTEQHVKEGREKETEGEKAFQDNI